MRSHLTRSVFRRLLSNEPLLLPCHRSAHLRWPNASFISRPPPQRRSLSLFGSSKPAERAPRLPQLVPGLQKMMQLQMSVKTGTRPPPPAEIREAWKKFFDYKLKHKEPLNSHEATYVQRTFHYTKQLNGRSQVGDKCLLNRESLAKALEGLWRMPSGEKKAHKELAGELIDEFKRRDPEIASKRYWRQYLDLYIKILASTGDSAKARDYVLLELTDVADDQRLIGKAWRSILKGFAAEGNEEELLRTYHARPSNDCISVIPVVFYADRNNIEETKKWYSLVREACLQEKGEFFVMQKQALTTLLQFSIRNNEAEWCSEVFKNVIEADPTREQWDVIFQWAAGSLGKGVEDVERMIDVMIRVTTEKDEPIQPTMETINGLVSMAMVKKDPYLAERYIVLGQKYGLRANAESYVLQMDYRLDAGDLTGATAAFEALQSEEILGTIDASVINKYIQTLCATESPDYDLITSIVEDLEQRNAPLDPDTVAALSFLHLERDEPDLLKLTTPMIDILQGHSFKWTLEERFRVIDNCVKYIINTATPNVLAWCCYEVFRCTFQETPTNQLILVMRDFFRRRRSDMAMYVIGHMRQRDDHDYRPTLDTYIECLEGIALCHDSKCLAEVHNMLKLDSSIEPSTALYNSLILAYTECGDATKAMQFWDDISLSREGPDYRSLEVVFKACAKKPFGDEKAKEIWAKMRRMDVEVTRDVFISYIAALGGNGLIDDAKSLVENGEKDFAHKPDSMMIGTLYNAIRGQERKDALESWATTLYPDIFAQLQELGQMEMREGYRMFRLPGIELRDETDEFEEQEEEEDQRENLHAR